MGSAKWYITLDGKEHAIEFEHGYFSGRREVRLDGQILQELSKSSNLMDFGGDLPFKIGQHSCIIRISSRRLGLAYSYDLIVDGRSLTTNSEAAPSRPPNRVEKNWGFLFSSPSSEEEALAVLQYVRQFKILFWGLSGISALISAGSFLTLMVSSKEFYEENNEILLMLLSCGLVGIILNPIYAYLFGKMPNRSLSIVLLIFCIPCLLNFPIGWIVFFGGLRFYQASRYIKN